MPGTRCTVAVCNNSFAKTKRAGMNIMYHQFPKTESLRNIWIEKCRRAGNWNPNSCHICSIHFTVNDYVQDMSSDIINLPTKRRLKATAVPSLFLNESPPLELISLTQRKRKKISIDDKECMSSYVFIDNDQTACYQLDDTTNQYKSSKDLAAYESCEKENSHNQSQYENNDFEFYMQDSESYCIEDKYDVKEMNKEYLNSLNISQYVTVQDSSTQTNNDYFLENYKLLLDKNNRLENELEKCNNKYRRLMASINVLKSEIKRLQINPVQINES